MRRKGIEIETQVALGYPAEEILHRVRKDRVDLIVVGSWTATAISSWFSCVRVLSAQASANPQCPH
jgi:nucleotide-binding universal stress UspA family protein